MHGEGDSVYLDLAYLRDLLRLLKDMDVSAFTHGNLALNFGAVEPDEARVPLRGRTQQQVLADEDQSTSSRPVAGFSEGKDGWRNPSLWRAQSGKVLKFDGSLE